MADGTVAAMPSCPLFFRRPAKRIIDLLERAPSFEAVLRNLPDSLERPG